MGDAAYFDHYEVLTNEDGSLFELGRGAMGVTYKAFDTSLRIPVALKVINTAYLNSELARQRFLREARSAAKLRHRNVASVFHLGLEGDTWFYAMEFIDGETLAALIRRNGPLVPELALKITAQIARALNAAAQHGLVHRDIKPENLMLVKEDEELIAKVIDFGLAKNSKTGEGEDAATLSMGGFVGTFAFASPEQLEEKELDSRSDIYSLGVTLWYMLAGQVPFVGSVMQVMSQHLSKMPPFERLEQVPSSVAAILRRMLEKDRTNRYQTPLELRTAIESCLAEISDDPAPVWVPLMEESAAPPSNPAPAPASEKRVGVGSVLADRYEIAAALGETNIGNLFRAKDTQLQSSVCLLVLHPDVLQDATTYTALEQEAGKFVAAPHPNLLAVRGIETVEDSSFVVLEWINGFSLLELLRARRELKSDEVLRLLRQAAAGVDAAIAAGLEGLTFELRQVQLHFPGECEKATLLQTPVTQWPAFELKLYPLALGLEARMGQTWAGGQTMVGSAAGSAQLQELRVRYLQSLAATIYELLGGARPMAGRGSQSSPIPQRYAPLSTLSEQGNEVLKRALDPTRTFQNAKEFCDALASDGGVQTHRHETRRSSPAPTTPPPDVPSPALAPPPAPSPRAPAPRPAAAKRKLPLVPVGIAAGIAVLLIGSLAIFLLNSGSPKRSVARETVPNPPVATPVPAVTDPNRQRNLSAQVQSAQEVESKGTWSKSVETWVQVARDFPEARTALDRLEVLLSQLRNRPNPLTKEEFKAARPSVMQAAQLGVPSAMMLLGDDLRDQDPASAFNWYSAASAKGHVPALTSLGIMLWSGAGTSPDVAKAVKYFQEAAEKGDPFGCFALAECYLTGRGVPGKDERRALDLLRTSAHAGDMYAMNRLGDCLAHGIGGKADFPEAMRLFSQAANAGNLEAMGNLGVLYMNGSGVAANPSKGAELFEKGARAGSSYCMALLAFCLENGIGVAKNQALAQNWYMEAAKTGEKGTVSPYSPRKFNLARR